MSWSNRKSLETTKANCGVKRSSRSSRFKARVAVSADLYLGGFDTHANHDPEHNWLLGNLTDSVDYLWEFAETHEVADRLGRRDGIGFRPHQPLQRG